MGRVMQSNLLSLASGETWTVLTAAAVGFVIIFGTVLFYPAVRIAWRTNSKLGERRPRRIFDRSKALTLRRQGKSLREIATELGVGKDTVRAAFQWAKRGAIVS